MIEYGALPMVDDLPILPPLLISSEIFRGSRYASGHPLAIPRVSLTLDLIEALGWRDPSRYIEAPIAHEAQLRRFHTEEYLTALRACEASQAPDAATRARYHLGVNGNPIYPEMYCRPATACGGSILAAERLLETRRLVYNMGGGTHHGRPDRASGFCFLNDPVLAILRLFDGGLNRVLYVDLDAHHGDGVQDALSGDSRLLFISIHEEGRWPYTGKRRDRGGGRAVNLPVPSGFHDAELAWLIDHVVLPLGTAFAPQVLVLQAGCDALADDPLSGLSLSNRGFWAAILQLLGLTDRVLLLGGGGYNPYALARCWAGMWAVVNGFPLPQRLPAAAEALLRGVAWRHRLGRQPPEHWFTTLADPLAAPAPVRAEIQSLAPAVLS